MHKLRTGYAYALAANLSWGFFPIYFKALRPSGPVEILAYRILGSLVVVALLLFLTRSWRRMSTLRHRPRTLVIIGVATALIALNWGIYIYGVVGGRVVETALGYFINPLVAVFFGLLAFGERLRRWQWVALGIGAVAVVVLTVDYGRLPWIALTLAFSFAGYGLVKKRLGLPPTDGLFAESGMLALPALAYLGWLTARGGSTLGHVSPAHTVLLLLSGVGTAVPLLLFAAAANRIPMTGLGMLQYLTPILQLLCGILLYHEPMPPSRLFGFGLVWVGLLVFTWDALRHAHRGASARRPAPVAEPELASIRSPGR
ncbi:MAG: EamA family transporter RarD [Micromonosporaceae bacterium]|nr:EamA family transporter RarD [Micromonosporaceae bacterium]